jgi:hypothetical protein
MTDETEPKLTPIEQAMTWERMSGERLSDAEREWIFQGGEFHPPESNDETLEGVFDLSGYHFACYLPASDDDEQVWTIIVTQGDKEIRRDTVKLTHAPRFGPAMDDIAARDIRVEEIIKEMGLE